MDDVRVHKQGNPDCQAVVGLSVGLVRVYIRSLNVHTSLHTFIPNVDTSVCRLLFVCL